VCFRYKGRIKDEDQLNAINTEIVLRLQESGVAAPSSTLIAGQFAIRVANVNHRSRREDFEILVREVVRIGEEVVREG
jgi:glutamate/tyrosine decarboxylase-like PLP-dependent enzyme